MSGPSCPAPVSCAGCEPLSTASPRGRLSRPPSTTSGSDVRAALGAPREATYLGCSQDPLGPPKFSTLLSTHTALFVDPGRPSGTSPSRSLCVGFWHVNTIAICIQLLRGCLKLQGVRSPLRSMWFPVSASAGSFGFTTLLSNCNTRYGWLVGPYPAGTLTLQEAPSFAWRTNGQLSPASQMRTLRSQRCCLTQRPPPGLAGC